MPPTKGRITICAPVKYSASRPVRITLCFKPAKIVPKNVLQARFVRSPFRQSNAPPDVTIFSKCGKARAHMQLGE
jgi:hypothetical protein